ncbi:unnamed protein product [Rhizoctonia solani]|uniref:Fungal-specific transcription factor domain protein n=1 Tax=Rhizoctonia solani TaxID=456999 RepID=A0A8H3C8X4_9AGAM|nr:unnamed protein product [Rhizoctonia solani]
MSYPGSRSVRCGVCYMSDEGCRCARLDNGPGENVELTTHSVIGYTEAPSIDWRETFVHPFPRTIVVQPSTPLSPIGTPTQFPGRVRSIEQPWASDDLKLKHSSIGPSFVPDLRETPKTSPHPFSPQHQVVRQLLTPPDSLHDSDGYTPTAAMTPGRANCLQSLLSLAWPDDQLNAWVSPSPGPERPPYPLETDLYDDVDDFQDPENVQGALFSSLSLDRNVQSNCLPFILQAHAIWLPRFLFEPLRIVHLARDYAFRTYDLGEESRWRLNLLANNAYEIAQSADYGFSRVSSLFTIHGFILRVLTDATSHLEASRELDRQYALGAMLNTYELISSLCHVASLSSVLSTMQIAAPVFRRACPDSLQGLINLPTLLATINPPLQYYGTLDVLLGVLTGRPMFFRYDVEFTPEAPESLFFLENGPALRWLYGVPDRLVLTFAKMNALFEDFGPRVGKDIVGELEVEIRDMKSITGTSLEPSISMARLVVQECWFLTALIYLYMGLCGADALDARVVNVRLQFTNILSTMKPKRNPDMFLVSPMLILGVATDDPDEQNAVRKRMLGVSECSRPGTMGNDFVRALDNVWALGRPAVWGDLRQALWEISGM